MYICDIHAPTLRCFTGVSAQVTIIDMHHLITGVSVQVTATDLHHLTCTICIDVDVFLRPPAPPDFNIYVCIFDNMYVYACIYV